MNNVQNDNSVAQNLDIDEAQDAILANWKDGESPSDEIAEDATSDDLNETEVDEDEIVDEEDDQAEQDLEDPELDEPEQDEDDEDEPLAASDDQIVEITVNGETEQVSVKDLKRLHGQEASLTKKSQDLATQRKKADENLALAQMAHQKLLERAEARLKPFAEIDMLVASRDMEAEAFAQLRQDAKQAEDDLKFLKEESGQLASHIQQQHHEAMKEAATECVKVLEKHLPDWGNELYSNIRDYAVKSGLPQEQVDQYTDPNVIMLINKARLYDQSKQSAESKKAKAKLTKSKTGKTKVLSSKKAPPSKSSIQKARNKKAMESLRGAKDTDDIADVLMSRWEE